MKFSRKKNSCGFTLIEVMIAFAIFAMVIGAIYATWMVILRSTQVGQRASAQAQRQRITLRTIEDSLMGIQSFQASQQYYSFIVQNGDTPTLSFASRVPDIFPRNGKFQGFNLRRLTFSLESEGNTANSGKNLVLRQNPILMDMTDDEQKNPLVLAHNVKNFSVECWDTNKLDWVTEWDDTNSIPPMLRVNLVLGGNSGPDAAPELDIVRDISIPSQMMPIVVQTGGAQAGGGLPANGGPQLQLPQPNVPAPRR
jgi:prepilin-type N-terminal cleavage/methylation domain-containing protein